MDIQIVEITPDMAKIMLGANTKNRPLSLGRVEALSGAMARGEWMSNGDAIRIGTDGVLLDGQHRLAAIIKSGVAVRTVVVNGLPPEVFKTIDGGAKRSSADDLSMACVKNANCLAASARLLHKYNLYGAPYLGTSGTDPTRHQVLQVVAENPSLQHCVSWVYSHDFCKKMPSPSISAFCRFVFIRHSDQKGVDFFDFLESGAGLESGSPILALRSRLTDDALSKAKMPPRYKAAMMFKAFSLYCDDATIKQLRVRTEGDRAEQDIFKL